MKQVITSLLVLSLFIGMPAHSNSLDSNTIDIGHSLSWKDHIIPTHPRLYLNSSSIDEVRNRAFKEETTTLKNIKSRIDILLNKDIVFDNLFIRDGTRNSCHEYGFRAAESALLYHFYKEKKYLDLTVELLYKLTDYYTLRNNAQLNIHWYAFSRISTLCAYDWVYEDLSEVEKVEIGSPLLKAINEMLYDGTRKAFFRENNGDYKTGFYGPPVLAWYAGLVFYETGIDDLLAEKLLDKGYNEHIKLLEYRKYISGESGGSATACMEYAFKYYPWAEFNFFHTYLSATKQDISKSWTYMMNYLNYIDWNWLPGNREYGYGDAPHMSNKLPVKHINILISQLLHFYGNENEDLVSLGTRMLAKTNRFQTEAIPFIRFFLNTIKPSKNNKLNDKSINKSAVYFDKMGQVFMRSGIEENDTYALFTAGGILKQHKHFDNNNFVIYKNGYRALDTGARPEPGLHLTHYYCRTIAHNCILIKMPNEKMPNYWGRILPSLNEKKEPIPNDGGQNNQLGSKLIAFKENKDYVHVVSDATKSYSQEKASLVLRHFLYILPDIFIVFDKVVSTHPEYKKTWLLHTVSEPKLNNSNEFYEESDGGKLICRTLFPENANLHKIGGPGKQFWSNGKNWPMPVLTPEDWNYEVRNRIPSDTHPLLGQWRMEVSPSKPDTADIFCHIMQVGDKSLKKLPAIQLEKDNNAIHISFEYLSRNFKVTFSTEQQNHSAKISICTKNGEVVREDVL